MLFQANVNANNIGSAFFGFYCLLIGYLVFRLAFLPRIVGVLMIFAGDSWLTFLYPPLANSLLPYYLVPGILGEWERISRILRSLPSTTSGST